MKRLFTILALALLAVCAKAGSLGQIIPQPSNYTLGKGTLRISGASFKCDPRLDQPTMEAISKFAAQLSLVSGKTSTVAATIGLEDAISIEGGVKGLVFIKDEKLGAEAYTISVAGKAAIIRCNGLNGALYAIQTIKQLLPAAIYGNTAAVNEKYIIPCCEIEDSPRFAYRGMHLDCARHFFEVDEVKRYLDIMAMYKLNRLHWHLTEDQGWRIEVKKYPLLSQISPYREGTMIGHDFNSSDHIRYGNFYTQEDIKDVVEYAASLGITVIPEIDLPGHMLAAMAAYPWLGCTGGPYETWTRWGISDQVLCVGKESTFKFLEDVLTEVAALFPSEYFHIGGDECPKTEWEKCPDCQAKIKELGLKDTEEFTAEQYLQNYVTARVQKILAGLGKKIIGWDEILEGELAPGATVMSWRGVSGGQKAAERGFDAIMTPTTYCYFDYCQAEDNDKEPLNIGGYLPLEKVYSFEPYDGISEDAQSHILGVQANLWTEYIDTPAHLEYMLLPRLLALSEVQWCAPQNKNYNRFKEAVVNHEFPIFDKAGYTYAKVILGINGGEL